jgi:hypothetical protein
VKTLSSYFFEQGLEGEEATSALEEEVNTMNSKEV